MEQEITWMRCLIIGISVVIPLLFSQCVPGTVDVPIDAEFLYVNNTREDVVFLGVLNVHDNNIFPTYVRNPSDTCGTPSYICDYTLEAQDSVTFIKTSDGGGDDSPLGNCCQGLLSSLFISDISLIYADTLCMKLPVDSRMGRNLEEEGPHLIENYQSKDFQNKSYPHYQFRYEFNEEFFKEAKPGSNDE